MDKVRFGRALGEGARQAAKSLMQVAEAAAAPDPNPRPKQHSSLTAQPQPSAPKASSSDNIAPRNLTKGGKRLGEAVWSPFVRLSGVLWLEFTGVFFGIFALVAMQGIWKMRTALHAGASLHDRQKLLLAALIALTFSYFCISSFLRAHRRGKRR